jgi:uncharacterized protein (TIGR03545 family)
MRKNFIFFVLIPLVVLLIVVYLFIDMWVEAGLEAAGESAVGAKVEIDNLKVTLSPIGIQWERLQVANPNDTWVNMFETGKVRFAMNFGQLLRNKYIIETMEVNDLLIGTKRTTDGGLPRKKETTSPQSGGSTFTSLASNVVGKALEQTPVFNIDNIKKGLNVDSLMKILDVRTLKHIDTLKQQVLVTSQQWQSSLNDFENSKVRLLEIEKNIKAINPNELKSVDKITAAISTVDNSIKNVNEIKQSFENRKASITADIQKVSGAVGTIDDVVKQDYQRLLSMAHLPNLNTNGIAQLLVGQEMYKRALSYLHWVDFARAHIKKSPSKPEEEEPPRMKGQNIHFPVERSYPKFWIKKVLISGGKGEMPEEEYIRAKGEVRDISNDQTITGVPLTVDLQGVEGGGRTFTLGALIDRRKDIPYDEFSAHLGGVPLAEFSLGRNDFLPARVTNARMSSSVNMKIPGNDFDARTQLDFRNVKLQFEAEPKNTIEKIVRNVLERINGFTASLRLWNTGGSFDVAFATDLADQISSRLKDVLGREFAKLQNDLRTKLDAIVSGKKQEFEKLFASKKADVERQLDGYQSLVNEKLAFVEGKKKELTDKLDKETKGKGGDLLKKLFK